MELESTYQETDDGQGQDKKVVRVLVGFESAVQDVFDAFALALGVYAAVVARAFAAEVGRLCFRQGGQNRPQSQESETRAKTSCKDQGPVFWRGHPRFCSNLD